MQIHRVTKSRTQKIIGRILGVLPSPPLQEDENGNWNCQILWNKRCCFTIHHRFVSLLGYSPFGPLHAAKHSISLFYHREYLFQMFPPFQRSIPFQLSGCCRSKSSSFFSPVARISRRVACIWASTCTLFNSWTRAMHRIGYQLAVTQLEMGFVVRAASH